MADIETMEFDHRYKIENMMRAPWQDRRPPLWAKLLGCTSSYWDGFQRGEATFRAWYGEVTVGKWQFAFDVGSYGSPHLHVAVPGFSVFLKIGRWSWLQRLLGKEIDCERRRFGFTTFQRSVHLHFGRRYKIVDLPWGWRFERSEYLDADGDWIDNRFRPYTLGGDDPSKGPDPLVVTYPYHYMTNQGAAQHVNATVYVRRTFLRWTLFGLTIKRRIEHAIDISFDEEVGNQRGSWKGGVLGCGYTMKPGETPGETLRRMQRERRFCR